MHSPRARYPNGPGKISGKPVYTVQQLKDRLPGGMLSQFSRKAGKSV
ncbi:MAG: hypothetical protein K1565_17725 [Candidatus Thiodiazotropha sp. (ex. Lucinisca nassula)]|nr:hypothetical protein [Candidatus Thiodiazotropha sp. (ex. Lucinisca nassula)]